jgi:hypothetical protein
VLDLAIAETPLSAHQFSVEDSPMLVTVRNGFESVNITEGMRKGSRDEELGLKAFNLIGGAAHNSFTILAVTEEDKGNVMEMN